MARYNATRNQYQWSPGSDEDTVYTANGAIAASEGVHVIAKTGSLAAMTLAPPTADMEGMRLTILSRTAFVHTVTITEGIAGRGATHDVISFPNVGDSITLVADNLHWCVIAQFGATIA